MALNQTNKLVWIVETILHADKISFEELNQRWMDNEDLSCGEKMLKRTFHKWRQNILDTFGLNIECETGGEYRYYISNPLVLRNGSIEKWLLSTYSISNSLQSSKSLKDRIILEDIPSGMRFLDPIIDTMKKNKLIHITYYNYWRGDERKHYVMPLCVKLFRQRWYVVGKAWTTGVVTIFCLDRIRDFRSSSHIFEYPDDFFPKEFFEGNFGVIPDFDKPVETVKLKVSAHQANYMRDLPMMLDQKEVERNKEYSIFELHVRPTYDFIQELLWNREELEVLEPQQLRDEVAGIVEKMWKKYNN